jgi:small GTP-binding protein
MGRSFDVKVVLLGAGGVGKTSIVGRAVSDEFRIETPTISACFTSKDIDVGDVTISLEIWDTAGQERFRTLAPLYYRETVVAILVYSLTDEKSLQDVQDWAAEIGNNTDEMPKLFLVGNKNDLEDERKVIPGEGETVAQNLSARYLEVSAKTGSGISDLFVKVAEEAARKLREDGLMGPLGGDRVFTIDETDGSSGICGC